MQVLKSQSVKILFSLLLLPSILTGIYSYRPDLRCKCIRVLDGDTVILKRGSQSLRVRLSFIDAPEKSQYSFDKVPIGLESKLFLEKLILNKTVKLKNFGKDLYSRTIGEIFYQNYSINELMVTQGMAISFMNNKKIRFNIAEYKAKIQRKGIWKTSGFYEPKKYRKMFK